MKIVKRKEDATQMTQEKAFILGIITEKAYHSGGIKGNFYRVKGGEGLPYGCTGRMGWCTQIINGRSKKTLVIFDEECSDLLHYATIYTEDVTTRTLKGKRGWYTNSFDYINEGR